MYEHDHKRQFGPTRGQIEDALEELTESPPDDLPSTSTARTLDKAGMIPMSIEGRHIVELHVEPGQPEHGEMRSDDHISQYVVDFDLECDECERITTHRHEYHAYHHIAGSVLTQCRSCGNKVEHEEWS